MSITGHGLLRAAAAALTLLGTAWISLAGSTPAAAAYTPDPSFLNQVVTLTNAQRAQAGFGPLTINPALTQSAQSYAGLMASSGCFAHTCGAVPDFTQRDLQAGYGSNWTAMGENLAAGFAGSPQAVLNGWMNSPEHRANILNPTYTEIGVGYQPASGQYGAYWDQEFGARADVQAVQPQSSSGLGAQDQSTGAS